WDEGRPKLAKEQCEHSHNEHDGRRDRKLDVGDRGTDQQCAVINDVDIDRCRHPVFELRDHIEDFVHGLDDVGIWLFENVEDDGGFAVERACAVFVRCRVDDVGNVPQLYRRAAASLHDDVLEVRGL